MKAFHTVNAINNFHLRFQFHWNSIKRVRWRESSRDLYVEYIKFFVFSIFVLFRFQFEMYKASENESNHNFPPTEMSSNLVSTKSA